MSKNETKYSKAEYEFVCSLIWGSVPVDRKAAEELPIFKTSAEELLKKYPKLDKSFHEDMSNIYDQYGTKRIIVSDVSVDLETSIIDFNESKFSKYAKPVLMEGYLIIFNQPDAEGNVYTRESMTPEAVGKMLPKDCVHGFSIDDKGLKIITPIR